MTKLKPNMSWIGHTIGGRYKIEEMLGQGGMSAVYKATDPNLQRTVAIKLIHPHLSSDPEFVRRFEQEAAAVAQLRHPNIIQVYDFNHDDDLYYMVLEYVPGETLRDRLKALDAAKQRFPLADTIQIMATTAGAVAYAHERGMIHRDLKPPNLMLTPRGQPILMDFGVAKMLGGTQHTATGTIIGTAKYMSPEQARGMHPDERSDIYSLGVMLYEMVAGHPPFDADTSVAVLMKHVNEPVPDIRQIQSDIPDELVAVIEKALAKNREDRYQTATEMAITLKSVGLYDAEVEETIAQAVPALEREGSKTAPLSPAPVATPAPPTPQPARLTQLAGRKLWFIGAAAIVLILILGLGASFVFSGDTQSSKEDQEQAVAVSETQNLPSSVGMVQIKSGTYTIGLDPSDREHITPKQIELAAFWIDQHEVTNAQYAEFLADTDRQPPADWPEGNIPAGQEDHPVKGVTWELAAAHCEWATKRLPTEAEWEVAARGSGGRLYPWGDNQRAVELPRSGTYRAGSKLTNQSPFGVFDMAGNVWEWVGETYAPLEEDGNRVLRGGTNGFLKDMAYRLQGDPDVPTMFATAGIRCAADQVNVVQAETVQEAGVLFQDTFANPGSGWPILAEDSLFFGYHPPDFYHVEVSAPADQTVITRPPEIDQATVETEVLVDHTDTESSDFRYGLALRRSGQDQYYAFTISPRSKVWQVLKRSPSGLEVLAEGPIDTLQGIAPRGSTPDTTDRLRVDASQSTFAFHINGQLVTQVSDADYASGEVGFFVETFDETLAHIHYDALTIREVETEVPTATPETPTPTPVPVSDSLPTTTPDSPPPTLTPAESPPTARPEAPTPTTTPTPAPSIPASGGAPEDMVLVSAGSFLMGSSNGRPDEAPEHQVFLDAFYIDRFELSNAQYGQCVNAGDCTETSTPDSFTRSGYRTNPAYSNYPVVGVTWDQADAYCRWAGKRLPTEAEWEYAASGSDNLIWPWGNAFDPNLSAASAPDTQPVDSFPEGASPFGVYNMSGNVAEWVQDVFDESFYANSPERNPVSTGSGAGRVYRGGSFDNPDGAFYTTSRRYGQVRSFGDVDVGFRCAADVN